MSWEKYIMGGIQNCSSKVAVLKTETRVKRCMFLVSVTFMVECICIKFSKMSPYMAEKYLY
jgi:hypothetical protein